MIVSAAYIAEAIGLLWVSIMACAMPFVIWFVLPKGKGRIAYTAISAVTVLPAVAIKLMWTFNVI